MLKGYCSNRLGTAVSVILLGFPLGAPAVQAANEPDGIGIGGFSLYPSFKLEARHDDNIYQTETDETSSFITLLTPAVVLVAEDGVNRHSLGYALAAGFYADSSADNFTDHLFDADSHMEFSRRSSLDLRAELLLGHEERGTGFTQGEPNVVDEPDEYQTVTLGGMYAYGAEEAQGRFELDGEYLEKEYTNHRALTRGRDRDGWALSGTFFYRVMPKTRALLEVTHREIDYVNDPAPIAGDLDNLDSTENRYRLGVTWESTAKTTGTVKLGWAEKDFDDPDRNDFDGFSWEVGVEWAPQTYSIVELSTARRARETIGIGSFIDTQVLDLAWTHQWNNRVSSLVSGRWTEDDYKGDVQEDDSTDYSVKVDYQFHRKALVGAGVTWSERDSNVAGQSYERTAFFISVDMAI